MRTKPSLLDAAKLRLKAAARERLPGAEARLSQMRQGAEELRNRLEDALRSASSAQTSDTARVTSVPTAISPATPGDLSEARPEPPVVARLMVEIRSDGTRTIARGAVHDEQTGERVAIEAFGASPLELAGQLAKSLLTTPFAQIGWGNGLLSRKRPKDP
jgi:hypothetical protein